MKYFAGHEAPILSLNVYEEKRWIVKKEFIYFKENENDFLGNFVL
jgi:hypothetical protein